MKKIKEMIVKLVAIWSLNPGQNYFESHSGIFKKINITYEKNV